MKKIIALLFAFIISTNVYSESLESTVYYESPARYVLQIPETVQADGTVYFFNATDMDLKENQVLNISISGTNDGIISMSTSGGRQMTAQVYKDNTPIAGDCVLSQFHGMDLNGSGSMFILPVTVDGAGDYVGHITFNIDLVAE